VRAQVQLEVAGEASAEDDEPLDVVAGEQLVGAGAQVEVLQPQPAQ